MRSIAGWVVLVCFGLSLLGCATEPSLKDDEQLQSLVKAMIKYNNEMAEKRKTRQEKGIFAFSIEQIDGKYAISVDLGNASIPGVIARIFKETGQSYLLDNVALYGTVTAKFEKRSLLESLNLILDSVELTAEISDGMYIIRSPGDRQAGSGEDIVHAEVPLKNMEIDSAVSLLQGVFPVMGEGGIRSISFGPVAASNTIHIQGTREHVNSAVQLLMKADQEVEHVVIEALVVEFSSGDLEQINSRIQELQDGHFSGAGLNYRAGTSNLINFSFDGNQVNNLFTFKAAVDFLISTQKARLISRPYISTISGREAKIEIASDRYVIVDEASGSSSVRPVTSGVILKIIPTVLPDGRLRMNVDVEDSQFSSINLANVSTEVNKNAATTTMLVEDGQTIVIGGLVINRRSWKNQGFPFLRNVPIFNMVFADKSNEYTEKEVAIYVTPHVWKPGMISPMIDPGALTSKEDAKGVKAFIDKIK